MTTCLSRVVCSLILSPGSKVCTVQCFGGGGGGIVCFEFTCCSISYVREGKVKEMRLVLGEEGTEVCSISHTDKVLLPALGEEWELLGELGIEAPGVCSQFSQGKWELVH